MPTSSEWPLPFWYSNQNIVCIFHLSHPCLDKALGLCKGEDMILTPWCKIFFERLTVTQLVKEQPAFLWNPKVHYNAHKSLQTDHILSQSNPVLHIDRYLPKVHNVILPPTPLSSQVSLSFGHPNQNPANTSPPCVLPVPPTSTSLI